MTVSPDGGPEAEEEEEEGGCCWVEDDGDWVEPDWAVRRLDDGTLRCTTTRPPAAESASTSCDPIQLEIFARRFMTIATQMGDVLRRTARSTNIRDRLDFSCALFDASANLVANAPHIPVHLGAMGASVAAVAAAHPEASPGPRESAYLFRRFAALIDEARG